MLKRKMSRRKEWDSCNLWECGLLDEWRFTTTLLILESVTELSSCLIFTSSVLHPSECDWQIYLCAPSPTTPQFLKHLHWSCEWRLTALSFLKTCDVTLWHSGGIYKCKVLSNLLHSNCIVDILASLVSIIMTCLWGQTISIMLSCIQH